jgi:hypothetical protein
VLEKLLEGDVRRGVAGFFVSVSWAREVRPETQMETRETYQTCATTLANLFVARLSTPDDPHRTRQIPPQPKKNHQHPKNPNKPKLTQFRCPSNSALACSSTCS